MPPIQLPSNSTTPYKPSFDHTLRRTICPSYLPSPVNKIMVICGYIAAGKYRKTTGYGDLRISTLGLD
ncbi:Bgt-20702 [Blumeria graminis f. sp. tritici]|uniref:Bgt-20702 n=2 Tax=Blumeria graminis f. sp. tritici TaxID=62690 RepID=A0A381LDU3_BLUGR|nr:Bgt-20702 [Blumeria graminis f. sp. tritici]